jgi:hypothetical protein
VVRFLALRKQTGGRLARCSKSCFEQAVAEWRVMREVGEWLRGWGTFSIG